MSPGTEEVTLEEQVVRSLPLRPAQVGEPAEGYRVKGIQLVPEVVGAREVGHHALELHGATAISLEPVEDRTELGGQHAQSGHAGVDHDVDPGLPGTDPFTTSRFRSVSTFRITRPRVVVCLPP